MSRTIVRFLRTDAAPVPQWGVQFGNKIAPLPIQASTTGELLANDWEMLWSLDESRASVPLDSVRLLSPVTQNQQFLCQGVNYLSHVVESGLRVENFPFNTLFTKASSSITSADAPVVRPPHVRLLDYEIELGLVFRRALPPDATIHADDLGRWLAGVTIVNDLSARDVQLPQGQFYKGKSYRGFGPVGPALLLLTAEEWTRWPQLRMRLSVNGQVRQDAYCEEMLHKPADTLRELATLQDVHAGDLLATGTPAGCAARAPGKAVMFAMRHFMSDATKWRLFVQKASGNPAYLQPGDRLRASIRTDDGAVDLGEQTTAIVAP
jgi:2-keto-4-pentenoate hydratase/2-oxohepta-3-ene-1,7-dioic acid hydratase in catechol pathway